MGQSAHDITVHRLRPAILLQNTSRTRLVRATIGREAVDRRFDAMFRSSFAGIFSIGLLTLAGLSQVRGDVPCWSWHDRIAPALAVPSAGGAVEA